MNASLLSLTLDALGGHFPMLAGSFLRETQPATREAVDLLLPVVIGTLAHTGGTQEGSSELISLVSGAKPDVGLLDELEKLFTGPFEGVNDLLKNGTTRLVPGLFGNKSAALVHAIASTSGIRRSSATTLIAMIVPIVLAVLKKHIGDKKLGASSLSSLLRSQQADVRYKLDSRITGALGFARPVDLLEGVCDKTGAGVAHAIAGVPPGRSAAQARANVAAVAATETQSWLTRWLRWRSGSSERTA